MYEHLHKYLITNNSIMGDLNNINFEDFIKLSDYKVRILTPSDGTQAITRVQIESCDEKGEVWTTIGVSKNIIDASFRALHDSMTYCLIRQ